MAVSFRRLDLTTSEDWVWIRQRAHPILCEDTVGFIAEVDGVRAGAVVFDSWSYNSCLIHVCIERPIVIRRGFAQVVFGFVFNEAGRGVVVGATPANNQKALRFSRRMGMVEGYRIPDGYAVGIDMVISTMRKENCRWIKHGR